MSKQLRPIIERECFPHLPIRLETTSKIISFHKLIVARPELATLVKHLWIRGARSKQNPTQGYSEPTSSTWRQFKASAFEQLHIIHSCTKLVSLACSFPVMFLCFRFTRDIFFKHDQLKELTLFENWNLWTCFSLEPPINGPHLFLQLTHLTIFDSVAPYFPTLLFPSLKCFSAEMEPACPQAALQTFKSGEPIRAPLPDRISTFPKDVQVALLLVDRSELGVKKVTSPSDGRDWRVRVGNRKYFEWWAARTVGEAGFWSEPTAY